MPVNGRPSMILRRSRGYAPAPIKTGFNFAHQILARGAELKNTFCLTRDNHAFVSHHIGDLENLNGGISLGRCCECVITEARPVEAFGSVQSCVARGVSPTVREGSD